MKPELEALEIDTSEIFTVFDHDGNVHPGDIGQDYLYRLAGFDSTEAFLEEVERFRNGDREPATGVYQEHEQYSDAEELAVLLAERRMDDSDLDRETVEQLAHKALDDGYDQQFRDGFPVFLNDLLDTKSNPIILSAGDQTFLRTLYRASDLIETEIELSENVRKGLTVVGSLQNWSQSGIAKGCGNTKKPERYKEAMTVPHNLLSSARPMIYTGDGASDRQSLIRADLGLATDDSAAPYADIVVTEDGSAGIDSWVGPAAITLVFAGLVQGLDEDEIINETARYIGSLAAAADIDLAAIGIEEGGNNHTVYLNQVHGIADQTAIVQRLWRQVKDRC